MKVLLSEYKNEPSYKKIVNAVSGILSQKNFVSPIEIFQCLKFLSKEDVEDWRFGRIPYLEKVIKCNLSKARRILQVFRYHMHDLNMIPSMTVYKKYGKGPKILLRFTKSGKKSIEDAYSRHFLRNEIKKKKVISPESITEDKI